MKKKIFISHGLIIFLSCLSVMLVSLFTIFNVNTRDVQNELVGYLNIARNSLSENLNEKSQKEGMQDTASLLKKSNPLIRMTILSTDGSVLLDTNIDEIEENHLQRPEIKNLGTFYTRYSSTLKTDMMYIAQLDSSSSFYVRIAIPVHEVTQQVNSTIALTLGVFLLVLTISFFVDYYSLKASLRPLNKEIARLSSIVSDEEISSDNEVESLALEVDRTKNLIVDKMNRLEDEKEKLRYILNSMKQGLLILDFKMNILLCNSYIKNIFHYEDKENPSLFDLTILPPFAKLIRSLKSEKEGQFEIEIEERNYFVYATRLEASWIGKEKCGVCLSMTDITMEKNVEKVKRDFFANASHELKSPLTSIIGYCQMIKNGFITDEKEVQDALERILFESKRMNEIIKEMLVLSRLEIKEDEKDKEEISLKTILQEEISHYEPEMEKKNIHLQCDIEDFMVRMHKEDLESLISNLLENAIRYNKENGDIFIKSESLTKTFSVQDTGLGIKKEDQERIFERFYRVDKARSRKLGGTGLGLSIVKHICQNNHIDIKVESEIGIGSTFLLQF